MIDSQMLPSASLPSSVHKVIENNHDFRTLQKTSCERNEDELKIHLFTQQRGDEELQSRSSEDADPFGPNEISEESDHLHNESNETDTFSVTQSKPNEDKSIGKSAKLSATATHGAKSCAKKSFVWKYFRHPESVSGVADRSRTQCILCESQLAFNASGTTTTMLNHLKSRHGDVAEHEEVHRRQGRSKLSQSNGSERMNKTNEHPGDRLQHNLAGRKSYTRSPNSQPGNAIPTVKKQKHSKTVNGSEESLNNHVFGNGLMNMDPNSLLSLGCYPGLSEQQHRALINEVLLSTEAMNKDACKYLPTTDRNLNPMPESNFLGSNTKLIDKLDTITSQQHPTNNNFLQLPMFDRNTLLHAVTAFSHTLNLPATSVLNDLSPSSSSGLGLSVTSPSGATTTSTSPVCSAENGQLRSPPQLRYWSPQTTKVDHQVTDLPKDLTSVNGINLSLNDSKHQSKFASLQDHLQREHLNVHSNQHSQQNAVDFAGTFGNLINIVNHSVPNGGDRIQYQQIDPFSTVLQQTTEQEKSQWLSSSPWLPNWSQTKMLNNPATLIDPSMVWKFLSANPKFDVSNDANNMMSNKEDEKNLNWPIFTKQSQSSKTMISNDNHQNNTSRDISNINNTSDPSVEVKVVDEPSSVESEDWDETLDLSRNKNPTSSPVPLIKIQHAESLTTTGSTSTKRKRAKPIYISPDHFTKRRILNTDANGLQENTEYKNHLNYKADQDDRPTNLPSHQDEFVKELVHFLIRDLAPLSVVEGTGFEDLIHFLTPHSIPSTEQLRQEILPRAVGEAKDALQIELQQFVNNSKASDSVRCAFAAELWQLNPKDPGNHSFYMNVEIHGLNLQSAKSLKQMRDCVLIQTASQVQDYLAQLASSLQTFQAQTQPVPIVTNQVDQLKLLLKHEEVHPKGEVQFLVIPCLVTELATSMQVGLNSPGIRTLLQKCQGLRQEINEPKGTSASNDVKRYTWSEAFMVIQSIAQSTKDSNFTLDEAKDIDRLKVVFETMNQTLQLLHRRKELKLTASMVDPIMHTLTEIHLASDAESNSDSCVEQFKLAIKERLLHAYPPQGKIKDTLQLATLLDPRFKDHAYEGKSAVVMLLKEKVNELPVEQTTSNEVDPSTIEHNSHSGADGLQTVFGLQRNGRCALSEVDRYLLEEPIGLERDPFTWWSEKTSSYPRLASIASNYLNIPLTCFAQGRLKYSNEIMSNKPNGLGLPYIIDPLSVGRGQISAQDLVSYNFLWHQYALSDLSEMK